MREVHRRDVPDATCSLHLLSIDANKHGEAVTCTDDLAVEAASLVYTDGLVLRKRKVLDGV